MLHKYKITKQEERFLEKVLIDIRNKESKVTHSSINGILTSTVFFDVDDTLILHPRSKEDLKKCKTVIKSAIYPEPLKVRLHRGHIAQLKRHHREGKTVVVWSGGGKKWAETVIKCLGLEIYVDICLDKPFVFYDDLDSDKWMGERIYYGND